MTDHDRIPDQSISVILGDIARVLQAEPDLDTTLAAIVKTAAEHITGADYAGICLVEGHTRIRTVATTDEVLAALDQTHNQTGRGPCLDAITGHHLFRSGDLAEETRWPTFTTTAIDAGIRSMLSYRLFVSNRTLGVLNLYSRRRNAFSDQTTHYGQLFATHAAIALIGAQTEAHLHTALEHRDVIGTAKGILMQRHSINTAEAFQMLARSSQETNLKLHQVAAWLVEHCHDDQ